MNHVEAMSDLSSIYEKARASRSFSRILYRKMLEKGWRNGDLVRRMNDLRPTGMRLINRQIITSYTSGRSVPPIATALLIAQALECDLVELLSNTDNVSNNLRPKAAHIKIDDFDAVRCSVRLRIDLNIPITLCANIVDLLRVHIPEDYSEAKSSVEGISNQVNDDRSYDTAITQMRER